MKEQVLCSPFEDDELWGVFWEGTPSSHTGGNLDEVQVNSVKLEVFGQQVPMGTYPSIQ